MGKGDQRLSFYENFMLSGVSAVTSKTCAAPIERVKLMIQNQDEMLRAGRLSEPYKGIGDCFGRVMKEEGVPAFWRGNFTNCLRYFPTQALNFAFKPEFKRMFKPSKEDSKATTLGKNIMSGGMAGFCSLCFVFSLDYARTRLSADGKSAGKGGERQFSGLLDVYRKTFAADGIAGLYRGFVLSSVGIFIYRGLYFGLYDTIKPILLGDDASFLASFALGFGVTNAASFLAYPIDTIRRRMMMRSGGAVKYNGSMDCAAQIMKGEGATSFFKGAGANVLRACAGAGVLAGFDKVQGFYIDWKFGKAN
jgi:solute carrier family 25 (adenine nucleotide translocator) protein 4/5/6/31